MIQTFVIGLREGLEAALIVSILLGAATRLGRRDVRPRIWVGTVLAVLLALAVGALLTFGTLELPPRAEPTIAGALALLAVGFVTWMIFWMVRRSAGLAGALRGEVGRALAAGTGWGIVLLAFLSVAREGIETSLFVWSAVRSTGADVTASIGALLGFVVAVALGTLIAKGLLRLDLGAFFAATGGLLVIVAAGVLAYGAGDLQEAGLLPIGEAVAYDISSSVPPGSWYGSLLTGLTGFRPTATWLQVAVWFAYTGVVGPLFALSLRRALAARRSVTAAVGPARTGSGLVDVGGSRS